MSEHEHHEDDQGAERRLSHAGGEPALKYRRVCEAVASTVWALHPEKLAVLVDLLTYRSQGFRLEREEIEALIGARAQGPSRGSQGAVAVLPLSGVIAHRASAFESVSAPRGTAVETFQRAFREVMNDPEVGSVLIQINSPGGSVDGVPELAAEIRRARGQKPIVALADTMAASAAYWIASAADEIVVAPSGQVGSIGVYAAHRDMSGAYEQEGIKVSLISAGKFKTEGNPFEPLTEEARADWQATVDRFYGMFVDAVAKGRGVKAADVRSGFGEGRMVFGQDAVDAGMADAVGTFDETIARMQKGAVVASRSRAEETAPEVEGQQDQEPAEPELAGVIEGAEALLARQAVRESFAPAATIDKEGQ